MKKSKIRNALARAAATQLFLAGHNGMGQSVGIGARKRALYTPTLRLRLAESREKRIARRKNR